MLLAGNKLQIMTAKNWIKSLYITGIIVLISDILWGERLEIRDVLTVLGFLILGITVIIQYTFNRNK